MWMLRDQTALCEVTDWTLTSCSLHGVTSGRPSSVMSIHILKLLMQNHTHSHLWWSLCTLYLHAYHVTYCRQLRSLLCSCDVFWATINSLMCWFILRFANLVQTHGFLLSAAKYPNLLFHRIHEAVLARSDSLSVLLHVLGQITSVSCCMS